MKNRRKPPTLVDRMADAEVALSSGVAMFEEAAIRLDAAQSAHDEIAAEARSQAENLLALAALADEQSARASRSAEKVRDLFA